MIDVSVIVPVYNVEKYLDKCLDSVVNQTFNNYEIIIINDGSPDNSEAIIKKFLKKYPQKIKYYKKENGGLSDARNMGILKSSGKYLMFVDSDDYIAEDMIEKLYNCIQTQNSDLAICNFIRINPAGKEIKNYNYNPGATNLIDNKRILLNQPTACNKMYKKELFNIMRFDVGKYYEDLRLISKLYLLCNKISFIDDFCYYYIERTNSIMKDINVEKNLEIIDAIKSIKSFYEQENKYEAFKDEIEFLMIDNIIISTFTRLICGKKRCREYLKEYWNFIKLDFPNYTNNKYIKNLDFNRKIIYYLNSHKFYFLTKLIFKLKG